MSRNGYPELGTRVRIVDGSESHGDEGTMWHVNRDSGMALIELVECVWPVSSPSEVEVIDVTKRP